MQRNDEGSAQIWVVTAENKAQLTPVEVLRAQGNQWVLSVQSLEENTTIVVEGVQKLQPDMVVRTRETQTATHKEVK